MRLLVVEDEEDLAEACGSGWSGPGYAVDVAADAAEAYDRLAVNEYDLMLLDINLPDGDGFTLCRAAAQRRGPDAGRRRPPGADAHRPRRAATTGSAAWTRAPTTIW